MHLVGMTLGWLGVGSLVAVAVLTEHLFSARKFPGRATWWLIPALTIAWPWPVWVWYVTRNTQIRRTSRAFEVGLATIVIIGTLGLGWVCGSNLYSLVYPQEPELTNKAALNAMVEKITYTESNAKNEHLDETGLELALVPPARSRREARRNGSP